MPKKKVASKPEAQIGDYVEIEGIDSGASWTKSLDSPQDLALSKLCWSGKLIRQDKNITAVDSGGTLPDDNYARRHEYHILWTPCVIGIRLIKKNRR